MKLLWALVGVAAFMVVRAQEELKIPAKIIVPNTAATEYVDDYRGSKVLQCTATGNPTPTYEWRFNGEAVDSDYIEVNEKNGTLTIPTFTDREAGKYQCFAKNEIAPGIVAVTMSHIITLIKVEIGTWESVDQAPLRKYRGDPLSLTCDHQPVCKPPPRYSWYFSQGKGQIKDSDRIYVDETGTLHFLYLIDKDVNGQLRYKCAINNEVSETIKLGSTKNLEAITEKPGNSAPVREVMYSTKNAEFLRTKNAYLECVISGSPIATIKWFKNDKEIVNSDKHEVQSPWGRKLTIRNVQLTDAGNYECVGDTTPEIRATVFLNVISGPIWESPLKDIVKPAGTDGVFQCKAMAIDGGDLNDSPVWFRNGQEMSVANTGKYEFRDSKRVLTVRNLVKPDDIQCFQCKVFNDVSEEYSSGCLNVIEPITIIRQPDEHQEITKGDMVNLTVIATTDPALILEYWWRFNSVTYLKGTSPPHVIYDDVTQTTFITTSALTQEEYKTINGTYFRIVRHAYENKTVAIHVTLTELPGLQSRIRFKFCMCEPEIATLVHHGFWPSTPSNPAVAIHLSVMESLKLLVVECQLSIHSFFEALCWRSIDKIQNIMGFSDFQAGSDLRSKNKNRKLEETRVFGACCRHKYSKAFFNLKHGERLANAVYLVKHLQATNKNMIVLYDIACKLTSHLQVLYSPRRMQGAGFTDGKTMERLWASLRRFKKITKEMQSDHRTDLLVDGLMHFSENIQRKIVLSLCQKLVKAVEAEKVLAAELANVASNMEFEKMKKMEEELVAKKKSQPTRG